MIEAYGYTFSFRAFKNDFDVKMLYLAFSWYAVGIWVDFLALFIMSKTSLYVPELLAMIFMVCTIVGIAILSGQFFTWKVIDQMVGVGVVAGLGWLTYRVE